MGRRRLGAVDDEHRLSVEIAGVHDVGAGESVLRRHGDMVDGHPGQRFRGDPLGVGDRTADDAGSERAGADAVEDPQRRQPVGAHHGVRMGGAEGADRPHRRPLAAVAVAEGPHRRRGRQLAGGGGELVHRLAAPPGRRRVSARRPG